MSFSVRICGFALAAALSGCASAPDPEPEVQGSTDARQNRIPTPWPMDTLRYTCEEGAELQVAYYQPAEGDGLAALLYKDTLHLLRPWRSGSGSRYVSFDEQVGLRWQIDGREGVLKRLAPDHTARVETLLSDCVGRPGP